MSPGLRLLAVSIGGIYLLKAVALASRSVRPSATGLAAFLLAWPGVIPSHFRERRPGTIEPGLFFAAWTRMFAGGASMLLLALAAPFVSDTFLGLAGVAAIILTLHLGFCDILPWLLRWAGFRVPLLFDRPWESRTLHEFWSRRWNFAFVEMNQRLFLRRLVFLGKRPARFALFALSGVLHELALSYPAGAGWGLPAAYFLLHAVLVCIEERLAISGRLWTLFWLIVPSPWLFHEPFRETLILPFYQWLHRLLAQHTCDWYLSTAIYAAAIGHLIVLIASLQVPHRLGWRNEIAKLTRFNQKIFWVYGFYILLCIAGFAVLTWQLHDSFVSGEPTARALAAFIAVFWTARVLVDIFWYDHCDWPRGNSLIAGHAMLTSLFCTLAVIYWSAALAP